MMLRIPKPTLNKITQTRMGKLLQTIENTAEGKRYMLKVDKDHEKLNISTRTYSMISTGLLTDEINFSNKLYHLLDEVVVQMPKHSREHTVVHKIRTMGVGENITKKTRRLTRQENHKRTLQKTCQRSIKSF